MTVVTNSAGKSNRPSFIPPEPAIIHCAKCGLVTHKGSFVAWRGDPGCPSCKEAFPRPDLRSMGESDDWHDQNRRDRRAYERWKLWQDRAALKIVPASHPRYAAWMAFRCYLLDQVFLRRADSDLVAHIAALIVLGVRRDPARFLWFGDLLLDEELSSDLYAHAYDDKDHGMAGALVSLSSLLADPVGSRDDILPGDHAVIVGAFQ